MASTEIRSREQTPNGKGLWREVTYSAARGPRSDAYRAFINACLGALSNLFPFLLFFFNSCTSLCVCVCVSFTMLIFFREIINERSKIC